MSAVIERAVGVVGGGAASLERGGESIFFLVGNAGRLMLSRTPGSVHGTSGCSTGPASARHVCQGRQLVRRFVVVDLVEPVVEGVKVRMVRVALQCRGEDGVKGCAAVEVAVAM